MNKTNIVKRPEIEAFKLKAIKMDEATKGGAESLYFVEDFSGKHITTIKFQDRPTDQGFCGVTNELLIDIIIDRLEGFQAGPFPCEANQNALEKLLEVREILIARHVDRKERGVFNKYEK